MNYVLSVRSRADLPYVPKVLVVGLLFILLLSCSGVIPLVQIGTQGCQSDQGEKAGEVDDVRGDRF